MPHLLAIIPTDLERTRLGLPSQLARPLAGEAALAHTVRRALDTPGLEGAVLVHPAGQSPLDLLPPDLRRRVKTFADPGGLTDPYHAMRSAARKWSLTAWRGGLGGATCYDELLPAAPLLAALRNHGGDAALLVGADWPLVDPALCGALVALPAAHPDGMPVTFNQAPPGLSGIVVAEKVLAQLAENPSAMVGQVLGYVPTRPQPDPIGKDVCVQVPAAVRSCGHRFIDDTPRAAGLIDAIADELGDGFADAGAEAVAQAAVRVAPRVAERLTLPQQVTLELTPARAVAGPLVPHHYVSFDRGPMPEAEALRLVAQLGAPGDVALTLGGLGDALLHDGWRRVAEAAHEAGVLGVCVETDLLADRAELAGLLDAPIDVVSVRLNADSAKTYAKVMGADRHAEVMENLKWLFARRQELAARASASAGDRVAARPGLPWIVPRLTKTADTLGDMEGFFDRWTHFLGHAVIDPATTGCGLMPDLAPVSMTPPRRRACRQLGRRMTVLSDARVARCDQDWLGGAPAADAAAPLADAARSLRVLRAEHDAGRWDELELCGGCREWHRP